MADIFLSYSRQAPREQFVARLALILTVHGIAVYWDRGLESGQTWEDEILRELGLAKLVVPLWCAESVHSQWVMREAEIGRDKLAPARLQNVDCPDAFKLIQAADLIGWDGNARAAKVADFVESLCRKLDKPAKSTLGMLDEIAQLPALQPLPAVDEKMDEMLHVLRDALVRNEMLSFKLANAIQLRTRLRDIVEISEYGTLPPLEGFLENLRWDGYLEDDQIATVWANPETTIGQFLRAIFFVEGGPLDLPEFGEDPFDGKFAHFLRRRDRPKS